MEEPNYCSRCEAELDEDDSYWFGDEVYCADCLDEETLTCSRCGERFYNDDNAGDGDTPLCSDCYENYYTSCERCGCTLSRDDVYYAEDDDYSESPYCYHCYEQYERTAYLHPYSFKPDPIFYGDSERFFGVELEIDSGGKDEQHAKTLYTLANRRSEHIYIKTDGSLDDGLEIVTHPMSLDYHMNSMPWASLTDQALELGYTSHKTDTCGLHVHINRNSFTDSLHFQDECIARVLYIVERFWQELLRFSRRTESQLKRWANRYGYKENPLEILDTAKSGHGNRYRCINLENRDTIEFRIFRGTLKFSTILATLQLVDEICDVAFLLSDDEVSKLGWPDFIERIKTDIHPELVAYLKEKRLYINEPVLELIGEE